ncbi:RNA-directed DNA polymerase, eukaryota [Tanacetum coccineum]
MNAHKNIIELENQRIENLRQKARLKWALDGDENSKFFHGIINKWSIRPKYHSTHFRSLTDEQTRFLERPSKDDEIKFHSFRPTLRGDDVNSPWVQLSFHHFSSKAKRLKMVLPSIISEAQSAFITGRQIFDGPLIVNKLLSWASKAKRITMLLKVDFEKAFDTVNWRFLDDILFLGKGFPRSEKKVDAIYLPCQDLPTSWNNILPQKVNIMAWRLLRNKVPTKCNLDARGIDLHSTLCGCMNAKMLWLEVLDWWMLYVTPTQSVNELPLIWNSSSLGVAQQELSFGVRSAQNHLFRLGSLGF